MMRLQEHFQSMPSAGLSQRPAPHPASTPVKGADSGLSVGILMKWLKHVPINTLILDNLAPPKKPFCSCGNLNAKTELLGQPGLQDVLEMCEKRENNLS